MNNNNYLYHHGILGMKWGIRKDRRPKGWNLQFFAEPPKRKHPKTHRSTDISPKERFKVESEMRTWATKEQKEMSRVFKAIGDYVYSFMNVGDGDFTVIDKVKISDTPTGLYERNKYEKD